MANQDNPMDKSRVKNKSQERISASQNKRDDKNNTADQTEYIDTESEFSVIESLREKR